MRWVSTGLMYAPGSAADFEELVPLLRAVAKNGKLYATHMRSYAAGLVDAVREQIELARRTGCRLQISHLQAAGRSNWDLLPTALAEIEAAAREGIDVEFDIYPYQCGSTVLTQWLPDDVLDGGVEAMCTRLADAASRSRIADEIEASIPQSWDDITITGVASDGNASFVGQTLAEIARARGERPVDSMLWLLAQERGRVNVVAFQPERGQPPDAAHASAMLGDQRRILCAGTAASAASRDVPGVARTHRARERLDDASRGCA